MQIRFFGATQEVTGSCYLVTVGKTKVLVDCGLIQGRPQDEKRNWQPFPFEPEQIDAVVLTHAHLDHSGRIPLLIKQGFRGHVFTHRATRDICRIMFKDAAFLSERDAEYARKRRKNKHHWPTEPLYTVKDAEEAMGYFKVLDYGTQREVAPGVSIRLQDAGHILGSAIVEMWLTDDHNAKKLVFSGDLGHVGAPILNDPTPVTEADMVVMESTYGDRNHRNWEATWQELGDVIKNARQEKGNILIPAFALGRTQELLYVFGKHYKEWGLDRWQVFLDSPMAIDVTDIYSRHAELYDSEALKTSHHNGDLFTLPNLTLTQSAEESMVINTIRSGAIIIAGSGMCNGGRIKHHLKYNLAYKGSHVIFVGFQAQGTKGRALLDGARQISLWGETHTVNAKIHTIGGLSAHADQDGLVNWYRNFQNTPPVALVHGEINPIQLLANRLRGELNARVTVPELGDARELGKLKVRV